MPLFGKRKSTADATTIFFATDLHGSEVCFRKFVAAAGFYSADQLILGGDVTGKLVVPIVSNGGDRLSAEVHGEPVTVPASQLETFERRLADEGLYPVRMDPDEHQQYERNPSEVEDLFLRLMIERLNSWVDYARDKLAGTDVKIIATPGNDDPPEIDEVIKERGDGRVLLMEGKVHEMAPGHQMINSGYSNPTPWHTPREYPEAFLEEHIERMVSDVASPETAIFNIHVPPHDSRLDTAPLLDADFTVKTSMGAQLTGPVGSTAVRKMIEKYQPLLSLHGHVHESGGTAQIGRTLSINPGSEYGEGILRGALVSVGGGRLHRFQLTSG
jgi:uncharacterized protein